MKQIKLFIWDFDGTLMDTYPFTTACLARALRDCGHEVTQTEILEKMMDKIPYAIEYYAKQFGISDLAERYHIYHAEEPKQDTRLFPDVARVLARIREIGAINAVFTHRGADTHTMLERAGVLQFFDELITTESPQFKVKPAPDSILWLMERFAAAPEETVMIGDRVCDLGSGYAAGVKTCHLLTPSVPQYPPCDWRVENFAQMLELLA